MRHAMLHDAAWRLHCIASAYKGDTVQQRVLDSTHTGLS
jgi:hypothetical protein